MKRFAQRGNGPAWPVALRAIVVSSIMALSSAAHGELTRIADNVYSYLDVKNSSPANSFAANAGIVIGRDGILVVDTLISAREAQRFIKDIRKVSDKPIRYVVNTHYHLDHALGNCEFAREGAIVISQANDRKNLEKKGAEELKDARSYGLTEAEMAGTVVALPTISFSDRMTIDLGDETVELIYVAASHTDGSALVYLPRRKVLFAGDVLFTDFHPFMGDGNLPGWVETLDYILYLDASAIIPGHGPLSGKKDVMAMKDYIVTFDDKARELAGRTKNAEYIASELKKILPAKSQGDWLIPYNVRSKYLREK